MNEFYEKKTISNKTMPTRNQCVYSKNSDLEHLHTYKKFPIFMGCTSEERVSDIHADMRWEISKSSGCIQLNPLIPLEILYKFPHNEAIGQLWKEHHTEFASFLYQFLPNKVLEVGGANGFLAKTYLNISPNTVWTILDPNANLEATKNINLIKGFIDDLYENNLRHKFVKEDFDAVVHTHTFEHLYNPYDFLTTLGEILGEGNKNKKMIFSIPNMKKGLEAKFTNMLNFEHSYYMDERHVDYILRSTGFEILEKSYFKDHSIFYATQYTGQCKSNELCPNLYLENYALFKEFINYHINEIQIINEKISSFGGAIYIFGAHIFSQFLISSGLDTTNIISILDNGPMKIGKRLYGTDFYVESPQVLNNNIPAMIILKAGAYNSEIKSQLMGINKNITFVE